MPHLLQNKNLEIEIDLPRENYANTRFDWSGKISMVKFQGFPVAGTELLDAEEPNLYGRGFYNEFGLDTPLGFEEAKIGEWFHKIGVGRLKKDQAAYDFLKRYEVEPCEFKVQQEPDKLKITCIGLLENRYAYELSKEICLLGSGFEVNYTLKNTGEKPIITNEYNHNFLAIGNAAIGKEYVLKFPFQIDPANFEESVNPEELVQLGVQDFRFSGAPAEPFFFSKLAGTKQVQAKWSLENTRLGIGIQESGDFPCNKVNVWGWGHVVSPELFFAIHLQPGELVSWTRIYEMYRI